MKNEINITTWTGSNNVKTSERFFVGRGKAEPRVILNSDTTVEGRLIKRTGYELYISLPGSHSLWAGLSCMLCVANGVLYRLDNGIAENVGTVDGIKSPYSYVEAEDKVYISNSRWQGVFDPASNSISDWGLPQPPGPMLLSGNGNLPAGTYYVCMTNTVNGEISGNSAIAQITLTAEGGIQILNRPTNALVWVTDTNEGIFYLVGAQSKIVDLPTIEPLPSFLCSQPPYLENLCYAFGRIWGSSGSTVFYSQPFKLGWFRLDSNRYDFEDTITLIAKVPTGLYVGMKGKTKFLLGTVPEQMQLTDAGAGSIKGSLAYCNNMPELGWTLGTPEKDFVDVPVWRTTEGIVVGSVNGKFFNVSKNKIKIPTSESGASLYRNLNGVIQFLTSFKGGTGLSDPDTQKAFADGQIDIHNAANGSPSSRAAINDSVSCTLLRNGVYI